MTTPDRGALRALAEEPLVTGAMVDAALRAYGECEDDGRALIRAMLRAALLADARPGDEGEALAFQRTVIYHQRRTEGDDGCTKCGPLPVGSSFAEHLWGAFVAAGGEEE